MKILSPLGHNTLDPLTSVKARLNNYGRANALIQHEWRPKSLITISGEVDTRAIEKSAKIGLAVALNHEIRNYQVKDRLQHFPDTEQAIKQIVLFLAIA
ncbi:UNVERIFIED_CONTAM: Mitochondrial outer membrane protein porin of [Sesamum radiatum]|uniref:Mitochondrial outer membrane protein porin of n=1 Tax=Sesamum radiatum TaxID=300843 RepID=A0AAW2TUN8_SESRA